MSLRFGDGNGSVSIPEFLEFFTTPEHVRMAKSATAAVRMSLNLLQLESSMIDPLGNLDDEENLDDDGITGVEVVQKLIVSAV